MKKYIEPQVNILQIDIADIVTASRTNLIGWFGDNDDWDDLSDDFDVK